LVILAQVRQPPRSTARTAAFLIAAAAVAFSAAAADGTQDGLASTDGQNLSWLDRTVPPGADFFRFANGGWLKSHPIPADRSYWGVDTVLEQENQTFVRDLVQSLVAADRPQDSAQRKVADFYASGMDESAIEAAGVTPLEPELDGIAHIGDPDALLEEFAHLQSIGVEAPLQIGQMQDFVDSTRVIAVATQSGLGLPNRDYYLKSEAAFSRARAAYLDHVRRMFTLLGDTPDAAADESKSVMALETRLAAASMPDVEQRDPNAIYHPVTVAHAETLTPHLHWRSMLTQLRAPRSPRST
jgi:putative endopeptidase